MLATTPLHINFDSFELNEGEARLTYQGRPIPLTPKAFAVLCELARRQGKLVTKSELMDAVWEHQFISDSVLKTIISTLRTALDDDPRMPRYIETVSRRGYRFVATAGPVDARPQVAKDADSRLVGRRKELSALHRAWSNAKSGSRQVFWLAGEAGVGKTTLIEHFANDLGGAKVVFGQCVEQLGAGEPYLPVLDAIASLCRQDASFANQLRSFSPTWLFQFPWLCDQAERDRLHREVASASAERMLREIGDLLDHYTKTQPLLLVVEDMHWCDDATIRLLDYIARRKVPSRLMVLGSFRIAEPAPAGRSIRTLRHELKLRRLCEELVLPVFSHAEVGEYLAMRLSVNGAKEDAVHQLHARTEGLPLFVMTLVEDMLDKGLITDSGSLSEATYQGWQVPESLVAVVEDQIRRLPEDLRVVMEAGSVCGVEFRTEMLVSMLGWDISAVHAACDTLAQQQYWLKHIAVEPDDSGGLQACYSFRHALYREVFYQRCPPLRRAGLHRAAAAALERSRFGAPSSELAFHYDLGQNPDAAVRHYLEAADSAMGRYAPQEALNLSEKAIALLSRCSSPAKSSMEMAAVFKFAVACAQRFGMSSNQATDAYARAQALCDIRSGSVDMAWALAGLGTARFGRGEYEEARMLADRIEAVASANANDGLHVAACNIHAWVASAQGRYQDCVRWAELGARLCRQAGPDLPLGRFFVDPVVNMQGMLAIAHAACGRYASAMESAELCQARASEVGHPIAKSLAHRCVGFMDVLMCAPESVAERAVVMLGYANRHGIKQAAAMGCMLSGWAQIRLGSPLAAHQSLLESIALLDELGVVGGVAQAWIWAAEAMVAAGDIETARLHLSKALELVQRLGEDARLPELLSVQAKIELAAGSVETARALLARSQDIATAQEAFGLALAAQADICELPRSARTDFASLAALAAEFDLGIEVPLLRRVRGLCE